MNPLHIVVLDRDTLVNRPFDFDFPHTLSSYGTTEAHETLERIRGADIVITNKVVISAQSFAENPQLKLVAVTATGVNNVDVEAAKQNGTAVCNIRAYGNESVAEHAFMMMITLMRNLPAYQRDVAAGLWENSPFFCHLGAPMRDLNSKTLAIFGRGNIGKTLATYAQAFKMNVVFAEHKNAQSVRDGYVSFDEAIRSADVVSLNCPLTPQTANMIGEAELQQMKPGTILINCGRGGLLAVEFFALNPGALFAEDLLFDVAVHAAPEVVDLAVSLTVLRTRVVEFALAETGRLVALGFMVGAQDFVI